MYITIYKGISVTRRSCFFKKEEEEYKCIVKTWKKFLTIVCAQCDFNEMI